MMLNAFSRSAVICALLVGTSVSQAGVTTVGGGGAGVVCDAEATPAAQVSKPSSLQLLDLYEARAMYADFDGPGALYFSESTPLVIEQMKQRISSTALASTDFTRAIRLLDELAPTLFWGLDSTGLIRWGPVGKSDDNLVLRLPIADSCKVHQIAWYQSDQMGRETVFVNPINLSKLSVRDRAALTLHEALHQFLKTKESNLAVRDIVVYTFASDSFRQRNLSKYRTLIMSRTREAFFD